MPSRRAFSKHEGHHEHRAHRRRPSHRDWHFLHQFEPLTAERHGWMAAHNSLALIFMVAAVAHVALNGRALVRYARNLASRGPAVSREAVVALVLTAGFVFVAVGHTRLAARPARGQHAMVETGADHAAR